MQSASFQNALEQNSRVLVIRQERLNIAAGQQLPCPGSAARTLAM
jgi:hypothetical protein